MNRAGKRIIAITLSVFASASCLVTPTFASTSKDKGVGDLKRKSFVVEQKTDTPPLAESKASIKAATLSVKKASGYTAKITRKSKQKAAIKITTKDPKIYKYKVVFCENGEKYSRGTLTVKPSKKHVNTVSSNDLFSPGSSCYVLVYSYRKNRKTVKAAYKFKMDGKLGTKLYTVTGAKNATVDALNAHKSSMTVVTTSKLSPNAINAAMKNSKWYYYNLCNMKKGTCITSPSGFTYKKKRYTSTEVKYEYYLTASQDSALRKKYTSISKAATGSTKSKAKYFTSYIARNCDYEVTNRLTTYEFLMTDHLGQCSHYAIAFQTLCALSGMKCEFISGKVEGTGHAWNLLKIDNKWYWCDTCWADAGSYVDGRWMFKGSDNKEFASRTLDKQFTTTSWKKAHPMGKSLSY